MKLIFPNQYIMKKFKLLILDANIIIELYRLDIWDAFIKNCDVHLAESVIDEAQFYVNNKDEKIDIDLQKYVKEKKINKFSKQASEIEIFKENFDAEYIEKLDPGETESLVFLLSEKEKYLICSGDGIVYRLLSNVDKKEQGISLEEILHNIGLNKKVRSQFTKKFRQQYASIGLYDRMRNKGKI